MSIDVTELDAEEVVIKAGDDKFVFNSMQITRTNAQGQETYQIVGEPETRELDADDDGDEFVGSTESTKTTDAIPTNDVAIVTQRAGVLEDEVRGTLEAENGNLAATIA